jgi:ferredoxin
MRIVVDRDLCDGHGMCEAMAHEYFELDDDDVMQLLDETPRSPSARRCTRRCRPAPPLP